MHGMAACTRLLGLVLVLLSLASCASAVPPSRLEQYVGPVHPGGAGMLPSVARVRAALVVVPDTTAPDAAPALPDEALNQLAQSLKEQLTRYLPLSIEAVLPADGIRSGGDTGQFVELGKRRGYDFLVVVVASATEQEYPITVFLGWVTHSQPGWRRDNWSLLEAAVVDVPRGRTLLAAEGRGWATLDRPAAPGINQWYPVIWKRPQEPNWRWWPPSYEGAPNTLRVIAMQEAAKRLVPNFQDAWIEQRRLALAKPAD